MESLISNVLTLVAVIGCMCIIICVITEVTKKMGFLNRIPTAIQVYILSLVLTILALVIYLQIYNIEFVWYYIVGAILLSFFVAFVTSNGWDQLIEICKRFYKTPEDITTAIKNDETKTDAATNTADTEVK